MGRYGPRVLRSGGAAAVVGAMLLLTACGDQEDATDDVPGVDDSAATDGPDAESGVADEPGADSDESDRPDIEIPDDLELVFEDSETGDPVKDAVLADSQYQMEAYYEAVIFEEDEALTFSTAEPALSDELRRSEIVRDTGEFPFGVTRFTDREVVLMSEDSAVVQYCRNFKETHSKDAETGELTSEANPNAHPTYYEVYLEQRDDGVWVTLEKESTREAPECR